MVQSRTKLWVITVVAGCLLQISACLYNLEKYDMQSSQDFVRLKLKSGVLTVNSKSLEQIKSTIQQFIDGFDFPAQFAESREQMRAELNSSSVWFHDGQAGIGVWKLENRESRLVLVRYPPPRRGTMYLYLVTLEPLGLEWKVVSFEQERELGPVLKYPDK